MKIDKIAVIGFTAFVLGYAALFLISPALGPTDDFVFLRTLQKDKPLLYYDPQFPYYDTVSLGRFTPLVSLEYNIFLGLSNKPFWFFFLHAVQFLLFAAVLFRVLIAVGLDKLWASLVSAYIFLLPGFTITWFRLQLPERNVVFFALLLVYAFQMYSSKQTILRACAIFLLAQICLYYKETAFVLIGTFGVARLVFSGKTATLMDKILNYALIASSAIYLILYTLFILPHTTLATLKSAPVELVAIVKNIFNFAFFSDAILVFGLLPLVIYRVYRIVIYRERSATLYDSLLVGSACFSIAYLFIRFYGPYYLIPSYVFAIPAIAFFSKKISKKILLSFAVPIGLLSIINILPAGIHYLTYNKYLPHNFNQTLDAIRKKITSSGAKPVALFFDALPAQGPGMGPHGILAEYLEHRGFTEKDFDLKSTSVRATSYQGMKFPQRYTVFSPGSERIQRGDLLLVTPQAWKEYEASDFAELSKGYTLLFRTHSPFFFPLYTAKTLLKAAIVKGKLLPSLVQNNNIFERVNYYVYERR